MQSCDSLINSIHHQRKKWQLDGYRNAQQYGYRLAAHNIGEQQRCDGGLSARYRYHPGGQSSVTFA